MVFLDEKGSKIMAVVKKSLVKKFSPLLKEGECRTITNFGVGQNLGSYRSTNHQYKLFFFQSTAVRMCEDLGISLYGFTFVSFPEITAKSLDDSYLIDDIGEISAIGALIVEEKEGKEQRRISIEIKDLQNNTLKCTFWNEYATEVSDFMANDQSGHFVSIIRFAKIKVWQGETIISNSLFSTRLYFNANIDAVDDFKRNLCSSANAISKLSTAPSSQCSCSSLEDFLQGYMKKTLGEIRETQEVAHYITVATVVCIQAEYGWYYLSCKKCGKKVTEIEDKTTNEKKTSTKLYYMKCCVDVDAAQFLGLN